MKKLGVGLALLLAACGQAEHGGWVELPIPVNATEAQEIEAVELWNEFMGTEFFVVSDEAGAVEIESAELEDFQRGFTHCDYDSSGNLFRARIDMNSGLNPNGKQYFCTLVHELAHVAGFEGHEGSRYLEADTIFWSKARCIEEFLSDAFLQDYFVDLYMLDEPLFEHGME